MAAVILHSYAYAAENVGVIVNGQALDSDAVIIDGSVYVPLRAVGESLGAEVSWDDSLKSAVVTANDGVVTSAIATAGASVVAIVCGTESASDSPQTSEFGEYAGHGAGVIIKSNGTILTNAHVVDGADLITGSFCRVTI